MTDTTASSVPPEHNENRSLHQPGEPSPQPLAQGASGWESVVFPGQLPVAAISGPDAEPLPLADAAQLSEISPDMSDITLDISDNSVPPEPAPEDLVQLIQDLNQCNDALLLRVTELEEALERSQIALQSEIERTQASAVGLPVDRVPGPVQQQIAQLLSELDIANDGLRRTTIHNETLQTDLEVNRQRVAQLERECTLLQQRFSEKSTALQQAEETCRDLKARLHRQQRYTLQFKAALEKCLNMAPGAGAAGNTSGRPVGVLQGQLLSPSSPLGEEAGQPVAMPRSQQIQPWSVGQASLVNNPSLTQLLRGLRGAGPATPEPVSPPAPEPVAELPVAELPRAAEAQPPFSSPTPAPEPASPDPWLEEKAAPAPPAAVFTEPSPWGEPQAPPAPAAVPEARATPAAKVEVPASPAAPVAAAPVQPPAAAPARPAKAEAALPSYVMTNANASPSPLVYPLRSQKKITSIAAVELPSFGRTVRRR